MLKYKSAAIVRTQGGFGALPAQESFFSLEGSRVDIKVAPGKTLKILRNGRFTNLLTSNSHEELSIKGEVKPGDIFVIAQGSFFESFDESSMEALTQLEAPSIMGREEALMVSFFEIASPSPLATLKSLRKFIPEKRVFVKSGVGFEEGSRSKKTTLTVGIILLVILVVSIGFGIRQKAQKEKELQEARILEEAKNREAVGIFEASPELFLDMTLLSAGFKGDALSASGENLFVLDRNSKKIVSIEVATKKSEVVAGQGKLEEAGELASYEDRVFISDSEGIKEVGDEVEAVIEKDWDGDILIQAFAGNLYVLDKTGNAIYRYSGGDGGFGSKQNWLSSSTKPELGDARNWTFDGAIYVLVGDRVLKFSQGSPQVFSLASEISSVDAIYADEENQYLYVLDRQNGKVFVLEKDGKYKAQYSSDLIENSLSLVAFEAEKKIILLTGEKLLSIEMRHL